MKPHDASLQIACGLHELSRAATWLDEFAAHHSVPVEIVDKFHVVLDEALSNIIRHGKPTGDIMLALRRLPHDLELEITDQGPAFDPTRAEPVPRTTRVARRQVGGAGLVLIRALMDEVSFTRADDRNRLTLRKRLGTPEG